jgi:hypothetical protein
MFAPPADFNFSEPTLTPREVAWLRHVCDDWRLLHQHSSAPPPPLRDFSAPVTSASFDAAVSVAAAAADSYAFDDVDTDVASFASAVAEAYSVSTFQPRRARGRHPTSLLFPGSVDEISLSGSLFARHGKRRYVNPDVRYVPVATVLPQRRWPDSASAASFTADSDWYMATDTFYNASLRTRSLCSDPSVFFNESRVAAWRRLFDKADVPRIAFNHRRVRCASLALRFTRRRARS